MSRAPIGFLALSLLLVLTPAATAGVVVLKNGKVVVGTIPPELDTAEKLTVKRPQPVTPPERGEMEFLKAEIRWYDRDHDAPTNEYWEKFENEKIADEFVAGREKWRLQRQQEEELKKLSPTGNPSQESAEMATTPAEKKPEEGKPAEAPLPPAEPTPAPTPDSGQSSGGGLCALQPDAGAPSSPFGLLSLALVGLGLALTRR